MAGIMLRSSIVLIMTGGQEGSARKVLLPRLGWRLRDLLGQRSTPRL